MGLQEGEIDRNVVFGYIKRDSGDCEIRSIRHRSDRADFFASNTKNLQRVMGNRQYVVYPPEGPRPPSPEELREMARELARKRDGH